VKGCWIDLARQKSEIYKKKIVCVVKENNSQCSERRKSEVGKESGVVCVEGGRKKWGVVIAARRKICWTCKWKA
jgi:hypothetical protein